MRGQTIRTKLNNSYNLRRSTRHTYQAHGVKKWQALFNACGIEATKKELK